MLLFDQAVSKYLTGLLAGLLMLGSAATVYGLNARQIGVVEVPALNMRAGPGLDHPTLRVLEKGAQVRVLRRAGEWLQVLYEGRIGYVAGDPGYVTCHVVHSVEKSGENDLEVARAVARDLDRKIRVNQTEVSGFERKEKTVLEELEEVDRKLVAARRTLKEIQADRAEIDTRINAIREDLDKTRLAIDRKKGYAQNRLVALYKLHRLGEMNLLATADSTHDMFRRKAAIDAIIDQDEKIIGSLSEEVQRLNRLSAQLQREQAEKRLMETRYVDSLTQLTEARNRRSDLLREIQSNKSNRLATLDYLRSAARQMDKTVALLARDSYDSRKSFSEYQGLLKMPVDGNVISKFGKYIEQGSGVASFRNGIEIRSVIGAPVRAVFDGTAIYADWLKGYGRVIIIAHGNNYYTVYAHVEDLFCRKGDTVEAGEVIGTVGDTGSIIGPALYFEVRHHGDPVDPLVWIEKG